MPVSMALLHPLPTRRLRFRLWSREDLAVFRQLNRDPAVMAHFPSPLSPRASDALLERFMEHQTREGFGVWALELVASEIFPEHCTHGRFIGFTGLSRVSFSAPFCPAVEVGWRLLPAYWGRGYATEAAHASLEYGFDTLKLREIVAFTTPGNLRSRRVMERLGMEHDPADDFEHPGLPDAHPLRKHVLFRMSREQFDSYRWPAR